MKSGEGLIYNLFGIKARMPASIDPFLTTYGASRVKSLWICRTPIMPVIDKLLNLISLGQYEAEKNTLHYDQMYHLFLVIRTDTPVSETDLSDTGEYLKFEKNQTINFERVDYTTVANATKYMPIDYYRGNMTIIDMITSTMQRLEGAGLDPWGYDAVNNNCQVFIMTILQVLDLWNADAENFTIQETKKIIGNLPELSKLIINGVTDIGALIG